MLTLLLALACQPAPTPTPTPTPVPTPPASPIPTPVPEPEPDPEAFARVVLQLSVEAGTTAPSGAGNLTRRARDTASGAPPVTLPVTFRDYGPITFPEREIGVPEGLIDLSVHGFDPSGMCASLGTTGDSAFPCFDGGWYGGTEIWVSDVPPPASWSGPHVGAGGVITIDVRMLEECSCDD